MIVPAFLPALLLAGVAPLPPLTCTVTPQVIKIGAWYSGAAVKVAGSAAPGAKLIVTFTGSDHAEVFNRKVRFGPIWINSGKVRISGAPSLFLRFSTGSVAAMLGSGEIAEHHLDQASLTSRIHIEPAFPDSDDAAIRKNYLALKASNAAYRFGDGGIVIDDRGDCTSYSLDVQWPKRAPPAEYHVNVFEVKEGSVLRQTSSGLSVVRTGFPAWLADLAANRAASYGIAAVLFGALAGFGIDRISTLLFGKKRTVAH